MPIYTYVCAKCGEDEDHYLAASDRYIDQTCECGGVQKRKGMELPAVGKSSFQGGVILGSGEKVAGSFKAARKKKGWHRP